MMLEKTKKIYNKMSIASQGSIVVYDMWICAKGH